MSHQPLVPRELERIARRLLTGCPHGTHDELMERLEAMRDLRAPCRAFRGDRGAGAGAAGGWRVAGAGGAPAAAEAAGTGFKMKTSHYARDGGDVLLLALAIGCLYVEITKLNGGERGEGGRAPKRWERVR